MTDTTGDLPKLERTSRGWLLTVQGYSEASTLSRALWPHGIPSGVQIELEVVVTEPAIVGSFEIKGLSLEAVQAMEPTWGNWIAYNAALTADPSDGSSQSQVSTEPAAESGRHEMTRERAEIEWKTFFEEGIHTVLEFSSWFAEEGSTFLTFFEGFANPVGYALMLYDLFSAVIEAFQEELKAERQHGFLFGVIWEAMGMANIDPAQDTVTMPGLDTYEEHKEAFLEGVEKGRQWMRESITNHNGVAGRIGLHLHKEGGSALGAAQATMNELSEAAGFQNWVEIWVHAPTVRT
jgi:hypothetical protein